MSSYQEVPYSFDLVFLAGDLSDIMLVDVTPLSLGGVTTKMEHNSAYFKNQNSLRHVLTDRHVLSTMCPPAPSEILKKKISNSHFRIDANGTISVNNRWQRQRGNKQKDHYHWFPYTAQGWDAYKDYVPMYKRFRVEIKSASSSFYFLALRDGPSFYNNYKSAHSAQIT